ncbi:MAG: PHP domain-containing protein [Candidatus Diapherotrites archaeon]|uniref:PHP domain-containing protein n=1 Tax=Candidatus Iainarchaeum sp. TaxID=3101447 RepID=A0A7K4BYP4_9ARCH|nr:PHP domain-containing protein [Candidatus Diapherotrites archaeon]
MLFDLHLHSRFSVDALTKPKTIVKVCKKNNWGFSLTDHNNMGAYKTKTPDNNIKKLAKEHKVFLIPGEEIKVLGQNKNIFGKQNCVGEVVVYFLNEPILPSTFFEIVDSVKEQDALLSCPHPFDWPRKNFKEFKNEWKKFDMMEIYNARAYYSGLNKNSEKFFEKISKEKKISALGVSDAHTPEEIGNGLTEINAKNEEEFRKEIKKGRTNVLARKKANVLNHLQTQLARNYLIKER